MKSLKSFLKYTVKKDEGYPCFVDCKIICSCSILFRGQDWLHNGLLFYVVFYIYLVLICKNVRNIASCNELESEVCQYQQLAQISLPLLSVSHTCQIKQFLIIINVYFDDHVSGLAFQLSFPDKTQYILAGSCSKGLAAF